MEVKVGGKVIPASFLKVEGECRWGERPERERIELVGGQNPGPEARLMSKKGQERREQRKCQGRSDSQWRDIESGCVRVIDREEVRGDGPVEYFLPTGIGSTS